MKPIDEKYHDFNIAFATNFATEFQQISYE